MARECSSNPEIHAHARTPGRVIRGVCLIGCFTIAFGGSLAAQVVQPRQQQQRLPNTKRPDDVKIPGAAQPTPPPPTVDPTKPPPPPAPGEPPEEDAGQAPRQYAFNPLQAKKEISAGDFYRKKGNYKAAANRYIEATQWDDGAPEAFYKLGEAQEKLKQYPEAHEAFSKFITLTPDKKEAGAVEKRIAKYPAAKPSK